MVPADDDIAALWRMSVVTEVPAFVFELNAHPLPLASFNLALCLAVREPRLNRLYEVAKLAGNHAEEKHDAVLSDGFMSQATKVDRVTVRGSILELGVAVSRGRRVAGCGWSRCSHSRRRGGFDREQRRDICPLRTGRGELAEFRRDSRPWAKLPLEDSGAVPSIAAILVARWDSATDRPGFAEMSRAAVPAPVADLATTVAFSALTPGPVNGGADGQERLSAPTL